MVVAGELDVLGAADVLRQIAPGLDRHRLVADAMQNQGRRLDGRQDVADVDLVVGPQQRQDGAGARRSALQATEPLHERLVVLTAGRVEGNENALPPAGLEQAEYLVPALAADGPRPGRDAGEAAAQHERRRPLREGGREHQRHRAAFRPAEDRGPSGADRVHHGPYVADALLEGLLADAIGEALAALVEDDHARDGGEWLQQGLIDRGLPEDLGVGEGARNEDEVARTVAEDAVGDVDVAASRVPDLIPHVPAPSLL